ncbi:MAG: WhiB family transcriptional regulator [Pseudonocardiales bacterium]|nr:WhiB family transcriptional regulator [Pseudonocardiales bacterium]
MSEWRTRAACRSADPELFFPTAEAGPVYDAQVAVAKAVCAGCPVRVECLDEALLRIPEGIAGGLTPEERRRMRRPLIAPEVRSGSRCGEREAAGRALLAAGRPVREVARSCGVSERTAARWAARLRAANQPVTAEGSSGGHRAPLLISRTHNPQPGTRTQEGTPL